MYKKSKFELEYINNLCIDCPYCAQDRPDHSCHYCHSNMDIETCWEYKGYCSEKCFKYVTEEIPRQRQLKVSAGIICQCDNPSCAKCLSKNCKDDNCPTHTNKEKLRYRAK